MYLASLLLGRLNWEAFQHNVIVMGGVASMAIGVLAIVVFLTITQRWKWLWREWLTTTDHKKIGMMYIIISVVMLLRGLVDAGMLRAQQALAASPSHGFLDSNHFQQVFTAHGSMMIFFVAMGLMFGIINLVLPQMLGSRDVAFPGLNAISLWLFLAGAVLINISLAIGEFSAAGWLAYPPLSELQYSPGVGVDYWIWALQISGIGSLLSGINFIVTIVKMRCKGMTMMKMPMFAWSVLGSMTLVVFAFPILTVTLTLLALDRSLGMHFFTSDFGGNPMMYVNMIWAWGHPEVYILILPAFGIFSEVVATFSRKRLFGYSSMVAAIMGITVLSYLVWLHHFFTMGAGANVNAFFGVMTMVIAVPTGVKVFNWLFTMNKGKIRLSVPMLWFLGFVVTFTIGGVAGVLMAVPAIDFQVHNSLFLVAHFHTMIIGGVVFGYFAGLIYWFPKIFGFKLIDRFGKLAFWCWLIGFCLAFVPLYILGIMGATRRLDHYDSSLGWQQLFIVAAVGVAVILLGVFFLILQLALSIWKRKESRDTTGDPWDGRTLEWSTPSPTPFYNFAVEPEVSTRDAFWEMKQKKSHKKPVYKDIYLPANSSLGPLLGIGSVVFGFAIVWHIYWLVALAFLALLLLILVHTTKEDNEYVITARQLEHLDKTARRGHA